MPNKSQHQKYNNQNRFWSFGVRILLLFVICNLLFVILLAGCGDIGDELESLIISPTSITIGINKTQLFTATGKDSLEQIVDVDPTWSVNGGIGSITSRGLFTAGSSSGEGYVIAVYENKSDQARVIVTENGWLTGRIQSSLADLGYIAGITVYLEENSALTDTSGSDGRYTISNIPPGTYIAVTVPTTTFKSASQEVTISKGGTTTWDFILETQPGVTPVPTTTIPII